MKIPLILLRLMQFFGLCNPDRRSWLAPVPFYGPELPLFRSQNWPLLDNLNLTCQPRRNAATISGACLNYCGEAYQE